MSPVTTTTITCIVEVISSRRDTNGNCYHLAQFWNTAKGRQQSVKLEIGGPSNARRLAYLITGDHEAILEFNASVTKMQWKSMRQQSTCLHEGSDRANACLCGLFDLPLSHFATR